MNLGLITNMGCFISRNYVLLDFDYLRHEFYHRFDPLFLAIISQVATSLKVMEASVPRTHNCADGWFLCQAGLGSRLEADILELRDQGEEALVFVLLHFVCDAASTVETGKLKLAAFDALVEDFQF